MKWALGILCAFAFTGCALLKEGVRQAGQGGADPNLAAIPAGSGWHCYVASDMTWSACARTAEQCKADRQKFQKDAASQGLFAIKFGDCKSAVQSWCTTHDELKMQSDGSSKPEPFSDCMPDEMTCDRYKESLQQNSKNLRVSKCVSAG